MNKILKMLEDPDSDNVEINAHIRAETHSYLTIDYKFTEFECGKHIALYRSHSGAKERLYVSDIPKYTTSLDAAMSIGTEELEGWKMYIQPAIFSMGFNNPYVVFMHEGKKLTRANMVGGNKIISDMPRAICHARIQALEYMRGK